MLLMKAFSCSHTEDASETEVVKQEEEFVEKEEQLDRVFVEKIASLRRQLQQVADGTHPEYQRRLRRIETAHADRVMFNEVWRKLESERAQADYDGETKAASQELEEKTIELKEALVAELDEKRRHFELERNLIELTGGDASDVRAPVSTRKLRRRPNEPGGGGQPMPGGGGASAEKRQCRKLSPSQLSLLIDEAEILEDLKAIQRTGIVANQSSGGGNKSHERQQQASTRKGGSAANAVNADIEVDPVELGSSPTTSSSVNSSSLVFDARIEHNKLFYDKKWYHRGQSVSVESRDLGGKFNGVIDTLGGNDIIVKKVVDGSKVRITLAMLQRGKVVLRRKSV
ncbi:sin3 histone deacetylase corepressor complex component SDS3-like isoform X3 [Varroa jacobsoni]|uniref:Sin3 histone deacetylase corepressor complex component SDS3 n=1 Tax=Varroa destructor TaxID=109461 RepID=A0A7M7KHC6_VARDE|nr:sin3 histone deacetylase corepressor complex component SDS3-like isoform X3 [Varroa destructor]XP_022698652.1 sin3 histone deacetylase corepressor complex component SDS3-like isoform X3 [Varroa jacobsoni]